MACSDNGCANSCYTSEPDNTICEVCVAECADNCYSKCGSCSSACGDSCTQGGCALDCTNGCTDSCTANCTLNCTYSCEGYCNGCTNTCTKTCDIGCEGNAVATIYNRIGLNTLIKSSDIIDLRDLVINEMTRRSKTITTTNKEAVGNKALYETIAAIYNNLITLGQTGLTSEEQYKKMHKNIVQTYIDAAKALYDKKVPRS